MENQDEVKIIKIKNLNKLNWTTSMNILIDNNVNIDNILNIESYTYDEKVECGSGRAIVSGKIGVKVVYIDIDNIPNTLVDSVSFSETLEDLAITTQSNVVLNESSVTSNVISTDGMLKLSLDCSIGLIMCLNIGLSTSIGDFDGLITKKSKIDTFFLGQMVNSEFEYTASVETGDKIEKILNCNQSFAPTELTPNDGVLTVEGRLSTTLTYEVQSEDALSIKQLSSCDTVKLDLSIPNLNSEDCLNLCFLVDKNNQKLNTEQDQDMAEIDATCIVKLTGVILKPIDIEVIDDLYSCSNSVDLSTSKRDYLCNANRVFLTERINADKTISKDDPQIEEIVGISNVQTTVTQKYIKDESLFFEGIVTACAIYLDETKKYVNTYIEAPFVIDTKIKTNNPELVCYNISCVDAQVKSKHGDTIIADFDLSISITYFEEQEKEIVDNVIIGKSLDYNNIDYQIFVARPNETKWELCKRIKSSEDDVSKLNKDLPETMLGGEKIIIKRN